MAAAAYLLRPAGWVKLVAAAGEEVQRADAERADEETARELERLREELTALRAVAQEETEPPRAELDAVRKEADSLHRKLRSAHQRPASAARRRCARCEAELDAVAGRRRRRAWPPPTSETRRLRARLAEAEAALEAGRRAAREGRSVEDMRLRLLLDTVLEAAQGLRRELALPPVHGRPADTVDAVAPGRIARRTSPARALSEDDPALLDQLLALPQAHLVVDGYNVTKTGYPTMPLEKQRLRLLGGLVGARGADAAPRSPASSTARSWRRRCCWRRRAGCGCCSASPVRRPTS